jgi:hypothetical protein
MDLGNTAPPVRERDDPFDLWLKRSLHEKMDAVPDGDIPDDLLRLVCDSRSEWAELKDPWRSAEDRNVEACLRQALPRRGGRVRYLLLAPSFTPEAHQDQRSMEP